MNGLIFCGFSGNILGLGRSSWLGIGLAAPIKRSVARQMRPTRRGKAGNAVRNPNDADDDDDDYEEDGLGRHNKKGRA